VDGVGQAALEGFSTPPSLPDDTVPTILINDLARCSRLAEAEKPTPKDSEDATNTICWNKLLTPTGMSIKVTKRAMSSSP